MRERIAFVKTGWSDDYRGAPIIGRFAYVREFEDGHERFNFRRASDGYLYGYVPPIGPNRRPPQPKELSGWLVIFIAARRGNGPLTVVGWYDNATFESEYMDRPEYAKKGGFETDSRGGNYSYCIHSLDGTLVPVDERDIVVPGDHFGKAPVVYARGNGRNDAWRRKLAKIAERVVEATAKFKLAGGSLRAFPDKEHRDKVEKASMAEAERYLRAKKYRITKRYKDNCGYDLLAIRAQPQDELHVEVKGTSESVPHFFISYNEMLYMANPKWRLLIVTNALTSPRVAVMTNLQAKKRFEFVPRIWEGVTK